MMGHICFTIGISLNAFWVLVLARILIGMASESIYIAQYVILEEWSGNHYTLVIA